jgi:hypothetical protein
MVIDVLLLILTGLDEHATSPFPSPSIAIVCGARKATYARRCTTGRSDMCARFSPVANGGFSAAEFSFCAAPYIHRTRSRERRSMRVHSHEIAFAFPRRHANIEGEKHRERDAEEARNSRPDWLSDLSVRLDDAVVSRPPGGQSRDFA